VKTAEHVAADVGEVVRPVGLLELGDFGELKETVNGRVEFIEEGGRGVEVALGNVGGDSKSRPVSVPQ
jgi:hypothetical protein